LRRRAGAEIVDIDTFQGTCRFWYLQPRVIDFDAIENAADDASYELVHIQLNIEGEIVREGGSLEVVVPETGQRFAIEAETDLSGRLHLHTTVLEWDGERARLTIDSGHPGASSTTKP